MLLYAPLAKFRRLRAYSTISDSLVGLASRQTSALPKISKLTARVNRCCLRLI